MLRMAEEEKVRLIVAEPKFCADNAAMTAGLAGAGGGLWGEAAMNVDAEPGLTIGRSG